MKKLITSKEFLAIRHSVLNGNTYDVEKLVKDTLKLKKYINGRKIVPCFEGDITQVKETGEIILTHHNFIPVSQKKYADLKNRKLATSLKEVLEKIITY